MPRLIQKICIRCRNTKESFLRDLRVVAPEKELYFLETIANIIKDFLTNIKSTYKVLAHHFTTSLYFVEHVEKIARHIYFTETLSKHYSRKT